MNQSHIFNDFNLALMQLKSCVCLMANQTRSNYERAMESLSNLDLDLACTVIADDASVDDLEQKIDALGMEVLLRFQPVASDLRLVITSMKMAHNLERISDHSTSIAKRARRLIRSGASPEHSVIDSVQKLQLSSLELFDLAVQSFVESDTTLGASLKGMDKILDKNHKSLSAQFSAELEEENSVSEMWLDFIFTLRSIERIGDLSVNIGEDAVFLADARDIRHAYTKG